MCKKSSFKSNVKNAFEQKEWKGLPSLFCCFYSLALRPIWEFLSVSFLKKKKGSAHMSFGL